MARKLRDKKKELKKLEVPKPIQIPEKVRDLETEAKERRSLFMKHRKLLKSEEKLADFQEPCAVLMRRSGAGEWFENVTKGKFYFKHSDGKERFIIITGKPQDMRYAGRIFKMYVLHEDFPLPLPEDPVITTEQVGLMLEQALVSSAKLRATEWRERSNFMKVIFWGIVGIVVVIILYKLLVPPPVAQQVAQKVAENVSTAVSQVKPTVIN